MKSLSFNVEVSRREALLHAILIFGMNVLVYPDKVGGSSVVLGRFSVLRSAVELLGSFRGF